MAGVAVVLAITLSPRPGPGKSCHACAANAIAACRDGISARGFVKGKAAAHAAPFAAFRRTIVTHASRE
jgi:hypothetical protein